MALGQKIYNNGGVFRAPRRVKIVDTVRRLGSATYSELKRRLDIGNGAMQYHLSVLERSGILVKGVDGMERPYRLSRNYLNFGEQAT